MSRPLSPALRAGHEPQEHHHHRPQRQRKRPDMYAYDQTTRTEAHMYKEGGDSGVESAAVATDSDRGTNTTDDTEQQQALEQQNISQPAAAAAGHTAPAAKKRRCLETSGGFPHSVLQLPDGSRAVKMVSCGRIVMRKILRQLKNCQLLRGLLLKPRFKQSLVSTWTSDAGKASAVCVLSTEPPNEHAASVSMDCMHSAATVI